MKTKRKFSLGIKIASILSCVAVLSVGFASWLIVNVPDSHTESVGSFQVYEVVDNSVTLSYDWGADDVADKDGEGNYTAAATAAAQIIFGKPDSSATGYTAPANSWLQASDVANEKLSARVAVKISNFDQIDDFKVTFAAPTAFAGLGNKVAAPVVNFYKVDGTTKLTPTVQGNVYTVSGLVADVAEGSDCTIVVEFVFGWGAAFTPSGENATPVNPYLYYNASAYSAALAADAVAALGAIEDALSDASYEVSFVCE